MLFGSVPIGGLVLGLCVLVAVVPVRRPRWLATVSWLAGTGPNEVPFAFIALVTGSVIAPALVTGDEDTFAFCLAIVTIIGLGVAALRQQRAGAQLGAALADGFGPAWFEVNRAARGGRRRRPWLRILAVPWPFRPRVVEKRSAVPYGPHGDANRLDVYRHRSRPSSAPTLIHLHGGGFRRGRRSREARPLLHHLASAGWTCISANYRLSATPSAGFPEHLVDAKRVIAWARAHADEHGIDPGAIFLSGTSAGAHLTAMVALTADDRRFQPGFESADTSIAGAIGFAGYYGPLGPDDDPASTPLAHEAVGAPPFLLVHGANDTFTPPAGARALAAHLRRGSPRVVVAVELAGAQHSFDLFHTLRYEAVVRAVEDFTAAVRSHVRRVEPGTTDPRTEGATP